MKNYALSPLIENFTTMTSSKLKINVITHVENSLSYNISKFGRKSITGKRDNLNWTKAVMTSSMKITFFEFRCKYDDFISLFRGQGGMEWYLQLMLFPTMIKKLGVNGHSEELFRFQKWHVFAHFCIILPIAARADFKLWRARTALWKVKSDWKSMEIVNCRIRNPNHVKILNFCHSFALRARTTRARTRTDGKFGNALNDLVRAQNCL